ncbi:MAG: hypothetical protein AB1631_22470 [Acidobacteriota bacterium]
MRKAILLAGLAILLAAVETTAQTTTQQPPQPKPAAPRLSLIDQIKRSLRRVGATIDESKSSAEMIVSNYNDPKGGKTAVVIVNDRRKSLLGLYIYNFGSVKSAPSREEIYRYLLAANDAITIGSFFVDSEDDIGYKYLFSNALPFNQTAFESAYLAMAAVVRERKAEIRQLLGAGKDDKGNDK